jgi:uncharacterized protein YjlB
MALEIFKNKFVKITRSEWPAGTDFPMHLHRSFHKIMFVEKGKIKVIIWGKSGVESENIVESQGSIFVPAGHNRKITVLDDSVFFKFYWRET